MKITEQWLKKESACLEGISWFNKQEERDGVEVMKRLITKEHLNWANWLCVRLMTHKQQIQYAVYAAEQVIEIYETKYPDDKRPREAIELAKKYIEYPSKKNRVAAYAAANAAYAAANAAANAAVNAANVDIKKRILEYGIKLLRKPDGS